MNVAEYIVKKLEELGINEFFGLPGDYNFNLLYAIENNPKTKWIGCTNELNAGYAADGYARIRGFGAIVTTYGVGELSAMNAIAGSYAENIPVISIVGAPSSKNIENKTLIHHNFQDVNCRAFEQAHKSIVAATAFLNRDNAKIEIDRVLKVFVKERKPVYIAVPMDVAKMEISERAVNYDWESDKSVLEVVSKRIAEKINSSKKPVIIGDVLIKRFDAKIEYKEFVEKTKIPVTNFLMGTNIIDMNYEKYLGNYYSRFANSLADEFVNAADCLVFVGPVYSDLNAYGFNLPCKINDQIAIYGTKTYVEGILYDNVKMSDVLEMVTKLVDTKEIDVQTPEIGYAAKQASSKLLSAEYIYSRLQEYIRENDIIIAETGMVPHGLVPMKMPASVDFQAQTLWGSIGWATPATLGACKAAPNSRVVLVTGEGSHQLTAMEIGNMIHLGLRPVIIVINNDGYTIERLLSDSPEDKFNDIIPMRYSKFARIFEGDVWSTKVETEDDFDKALKVTQIMNKLCYLEVCTAKMDVPELTNKIIEDFRNNIRNSGDKNVAEAQPVIADNTLSDAEIQEKCEKSVDDSFETVVHKSIIK